MESHQNKLNEHHFPPEHCSLTDQPPLSASPVPELSSENAPSAVNSLRRRTSSRRSITGEIPSSDSSISSLTSSIDGKNPELEGSESLSLQVSSSPGSCSANEENTEVSTMTTAEINSDGELGVAYVIRKLLGVWEVVIAVVGPAVSARVEDCKYLWKVGHRCAWGLIWSASVYIILCALLVSALIFSAFLMRFIVQEPAKIKEVINFDYTKHSPEALVPILPDSNHPPQPTGKTQLRGVPLHHQFHVIVSLTLPESDYNRNLGVFQVRVDSLSASGDILATSRHPCMLQFKSEPLRLLLTILKLAPLVTGYVSESQTLNLELKGFTQGDIPTACLRVTIEQRAEFNDRGAGIPEIYDASIIIEFELPPFKRIVWWWRKIIYIWVSMVSFMMLLLFTLLCFSPRSLPGIWDGSADASSTSNHISVQD